MNHMSAMMCARSVRATELIVCVSSAAVLRRGGSARRRIQRMGRSRASSVVLKWDAPGATVHVAFGVPPKGYVPPIIGRISRASLLIQPCPEQTYSGG